MTKSREEGNSPLKPSPALLCKLGSIIVHYEEMTSTGGHGFDKIALNALLADAEIQVWISEMQKMAMLPVKRIKR